MKLFSKYFFLIAIFSGLSFKWECFAQTYPVQISTQLIPPYSGYLPDYADPSSEKLKVILQFNDFTVPQYNLRLKVEIRGNGFSMTTKSFFNPPPINLQPGQPLLLSGVELAPYLNSNNLDFIGINQSSYEQRMALPEGYYSICIKAYDYYLPGNIQVSNESCAQAWFTYSNPPILNIPFCNSAVTPQTPQNILFQWTPVNLGSPNSAFNTYYDFMLYEVRPDSNANVNQLVLSTPPIYSVTTQNTFINYSITEPNLNLYMKYVWRVRVRDLSGRDWLINNGMSQVCTFNYGTPRTVLANAISLNLSAQGISHRLGKATWNTQSIFTNYLLQIRKKNTTNWFDFNTTANFEKIPNLEPNTTYECRVRGEGSITGDWSNTAEFTTLLPPDYNCNIQDILPDLLAPQPLPVSKAIPGLIIQSGQFEITAEKLTSNGPAGWYSGNGKVRVFGMLPVAVKWQGIYIDDNNRHQQGLIEAETDGIDKWLHQWDITRAEENAHYTNGTIDTIYMNNNQVCYVLEGNSIPICVPTQSNTNIMVVRDGEGNQYDIQLMPPPAKITGPKNYLNYSTDSLMANENLKVEFKSSLDQAFGFDEKQYAAYISNYEVIKLKLTTGKTGNYFVSNKSIGTDHSDEVLASLTTTISNFNPSQLSFKTKSGTTLQKNSIGDKLYRITNIPFDAECVYAYLNNNKIGKLNIVSLKNMGKKLVLVPVNNTNFTVNTESLNALFKQANVTWSISTAPNFTFDLGADGLQVADADLLSKYSTEMKALRTAYLQKDTAYDKNAYYVFMVPGFSEPTQKGYMVRGRAMGFIAPLSLGEGPGVRLLAHELAHGAFALEHSFPKIEKNSTNNLMDYNGGVTLVKDQWEEMRNPALFPSWLDSEEDGSYLGDQNTASGVFYWINKIKVAYKKDAQITIPKKDEFFGLQSNEKFVWLRSDKTYLGGVEYDSICVLMFPDYNRKTVSIRNKIDIIRNGKAPNGNLAACYNCISVDDGKILIQVPTARLSNMKYYIENTETFKNMLLFVNGYRPIVNFNGDPVDCLEYQDSDNQVETGDSRGYWKGIDAQFSNRIGTRSCIYADGHHSVATSNHLSTLRYTAANAEALKVKLECELSSNLSPFCSSKVYLHTTSNVGGYLKRENKGHEAGQDLHNKITNGTIIFNKQTDSIDVVAHSMGYAYSVGIIKKLNSLGYKFRSFYIIAPENACAGGADWSKFIEVWQYGTNEETTPPFLQDGVAPQCPVKGITNLTSKTIGGRVYIPDNFLPKGFLDSHTISNYGWIFTDLIPNDPRGGYVKKRN